MGYEIRYRNYAEDESSADSWTIIDLPPGTTLYAIEGVDAPGEGPERNRVIELVEDGLSSEDFTYCIQMRYLLGGGDIGAWTPAQYYTVIGAAAIPLAPINLRVSNDKRFLFWEVRSEPRNFLGHFGYIVRYTVGETEATNYELAIPVGGILTVSTLDLALIPAGWVTVFVKSVNIQNVESEGYASIHFNNQPIDFIPDVDIPARAPGHFFIEVSERVWRDTAAEEATPGDTVVFDTVTQYNNNKPEWAETRFWNGNAWIKLAKRFDGSILVNGTIASVFDVIVGDDVRSDDYVEGESGWIINRDGDAEFNDATIRGSLTADVFNVESLYEVRLARQMQSNAVTGGGLWINLPTRLDAFDAIQVVGFASTSTRAIDGIASIDDIDATIKGASVFIPRNEIPSNGSAFISAGPLGEDAWFNLGEASFWVVGGGGETVAFIADSRDHMYLTQIYGIRAPANVSKVTTAPTAGVYLTMGNVLNRTYTYTYNPGHNGSVDIDFTLPRAFAGGFNSGNVANIFYSLTVPRRDLVNFNPSTRQVTSRLTIFANQQSRSTFSYSFSYQAYAVRSAGSRIATIQKVFTLSFRGVDSA